MEPEPSSSAPGMVGQAIQIERSYPISLTWGRQEGPHIGASRTMPFRTYRAEDAVTPTCLGVLQ